MLISNWSLYQKREDGDIMDFSSAIHTKMKDVNEGSTEPFIIYRDKDGGWHCDYTQNQDGKTFDWVEDAKAEDPLAVIYTGKDFAKASFPLVCDTVLYDRIRSEYYIDRSSGRDSDSLNALTCFFYDNKGAFNDNAINYLASLERPLAALAKMCPIDLAADNEGWSYNEGLAQKAIDYIENEVNNRLLDREGKAALSSAHCYENTDGADFTGHLLIVKAGALMPEYRDSMSQIVKCTHGNGARPNAKGRSIFCKELASDKTVVYYRNEIEGIANINKLPTWAKRKLAEQGTEQSPQKEKPAGKKPSLLSRLEDAKAEAAALNAGCNDAPKTKKRGDMEVN